HRLLVADLDVAPAEEEKQFPVAPQIAHVDQLPGRARLDDRDGKVVARVRRLDTAFRAGRDLDNRFGCGGLHGPSHTRLGVLAAGWAGRASAGSPSSDPNGPSPRPQS